MLGPYRIKERSPGAETWLKLVSYDGLSAALTITGHDHFENKRSGLPLCRSAAYTDCLLNSKTMRVSKKVEDYGID